MWPKPESVLFSTLNKYMLKLMDKNYFKFYVENVCLSTQYLDSSSVTYQEGGLGVLLNPSPCPPFLNIQ